MSASQYESRCILRPALFCTFKIFWGQLMLLLDNKRADRRKRAIKVLKSTGAAHAVFIVEITRVDEMMNQHKMRKYSSLKVSYRC